MSAPALKYLNLIFSTCRNPLPYHYGGSVKANAQMTDDWNRNALNHRGRGLASQLAKSFSQLSDKSQSGLIRVLHEIITMLDTQPRLEQELTLIDTANFVIDPENQQLVETELERVLKEFALLATEDFSSSEKIASPKLPKFIINDRACGKSLTKFEYSSDPTSGFGIAGELEYDPAKEEQASLKIKPVNVLVEGGCTQTDSVPVLSDRNARGLEFRIHPFVKGAAEVPLAFQPDQLQAQLKKFHANSIAPYFKSPGCSFETFTKHLSALLSV